MNFFRKQMNTTFEKVPIKISDVCFQEDPRHRSNLNYSNIDDWVCDWSYQLSQDMINHTLDRVEDRFNIPEELCAKNMKLKVHNYIDIIKNYIKKDDKIRVDNFVDFVHDYIFWFRSEDIVELDSAFPGTVYHTNQLSSHFEERLYSCRNMLIEILKKEYGIKNQDNKKSKLIKIF